ncbi:MAG: DNA/RNA non-specific endonuclease [Planctomycetota bacterium]
MATRITFVRPNGLWRFVDPDHAGLERLDNFRTDYRIPPMFRPDMVDHKGSGYDRGHLVSSANQRETELQNSETFLLSNMSPQVPMFNRGIWKDLEGEVRRLNEKEKVLETYVICGPVIYFDQPVESVGSEDDNGVSIPILASAFRFQTRTSSPFLLRTTVVHSTCDLSSFPTLRPINQLRTFAFRRQKSSCTRGSNLGISFKGAGLILRKSGGAPCGSG